MFVLPLTLVCITSIHYIVTEPTLALCVITGVGIQRWLTRQLPGEEVKLILIAIHPPSQAGTAF